MANFARANIRTLQKTASYYVVHILVAASVAYAVTGDWVMAFTLSLLEPTVQAVAFFCHEKVWERRGQRASNPSALDRSVPSTMARINTILRNDDSQYTIWRPSRGNRQSG